MADYCSIQNIKDRLTEAGYKYVGARNGNGTVTTAEQLSYIQSGISYAGNLIDEAVHAFIIPASARGSGNQWLQDRAVDIAIWYATSIGGRKPPETFVDAYKDALERLEKVKGGDRVPGLIYPPPPFSRGRSARFPRVVNPR